MKGKKLFIEEEFSFSSEVCFFFFISVACFGCKGVQQGGGEGRHKEDGGGDEQDETFP